MKKGLLGSSPFCFILSQLSGEQRVDGGCGCGLFGAFFAAAAALAAGFAVEQDLDLEFLVVISAECDENVSD